MLQALINANNLLSSALDGYLDVCLSVQKCVLEGNSFATAPPELSSHIIREACLVTKLEIKLQKAKAAICQTRNCSPALVPIHSLPRELLERIFLFVSRSQYNCGENGFDLRTRPEVVSHVCSRWRNVALKLSPFWSVIRLPLVPDALNLNRATAFAERVNSLPFNLQLHSQELPSASSRLYPSCEELSSFMANVSPLICSLQLVTGRENNLRRYPAFSKWLTTFKHGTLKTLITSRVRFQFDAAKVYGFFDVTTDLPSYLRNKAYTIGDSVSDHDMASIVTLRLNGVYPFWTSRIYNGLAELRLRSPVGFPVPISENHLLGILRASPALRILEFDLKIVGSLAANAEVVPVRLECLESLIIGAVACQQLGAFVRWLFTGPNPLQLSLSDHDADHPLQLSVLDDEVASFFSRSNIKEAYAQSLGPSSVIKLLNACQSLQTLALFDCEFFSETGYPIQHPRLESLFALRCRVDPSSTLGNINGSPTLQKLLFYECTCDETPGSTNIALRSDDLGRVVEVCSDVRIVDYNPIQGWAGFDFE